MEYKYQILINNYGDYCSYDKMANTLEEAQEIYGELKRKYPKAIVSIIDIKMANYIIKDWLDKGLLPLNKKV